MSIACRWTSSRPPTAPYASRRASCASPSGHGAAITGCGRRVARCSCTARSYLLPDLRDDKTPLFQQLEDDLLQSELDDQAILDGYTAYARDFREIAALTAAGAVHDFDEAAQRDLLHVIGVTPADPPRFYHRIVEGSRLAERVWGRSVVYQPWRAIDVNIPVRQVAPVVHDGRLHLFWTEITSAPQNELTNAGSRFVGYRHKYTVKSTSLQLDGRWTAPQRIDLSHTTGYAEPPFYATDGVLDDPLIEPTELEQFVNAIVQLVTYGVFTQPNIAERLDQLQAQLLFVPRYDTKPHLKPLDGYTLMGLEFTRLYPASRNGRVGLVGVAWNLRAEVDMLDRIAAGRPVALDTTPATRVPSPILVREEENLYAATPPASFATPDEYALAGRLGEWRRYSLPWVRWVDVNQLRRDKIAEIDMRASLVPINEGPSDGIITGADGDVYLLQLAQFGHFALRRLSTTTARDIERTIATTGVDNFLSLGAQQALVERAITVWPVWRIDSRTNNVGLDYRGAMGPYFRELFFHIPFLVADTLNGQQRFDEAQRWYRRIFDPTAEDPLPGPYQRVAAARGDLGVDLHLVGLTPQGRLEHTLRRQDGTWLGERTDVKRATSDPGEFTAVACAGQFELHVCATTSTGGLFHLLRRLDGSWQRIFGDVKAAVRGDPGPFREVACALDGTGQLHVCALTNAGGIFHALRRNDGSWSPGWGDVKGDTSDPGPAISIACATDRELQLHVCVMTAGGGVWHTLRQFDGTWSGPFGDVKAVNNNPGSVAEVACAVDRDDQLHVCALTLDRAMWHTLRRPDGSWQGSFGSVSAVAGDPGTVERIACSRPAEDDTLEVVCVAGGVAWAAVREPASWRPFRRTGYNSRDRNWRYREFRGLGIASLRQGLSDGQAIEAYKRDPFNAHAIARLRLTAYQKAVVMRYVTNLLDQADALFARYETETLNEAAILYATAADILGERPAALGACGEAPGGPLTYERLAPLLDRGTDFLTEIEHWVGPGAPDGDPDRSRVMPSYVLDGSVVASATLQADALAPLSPAWERAAPRRVWSGRSLIGASDEVTTLAESDGAALAHGFFAEALVSQVGPAFCVPPNPALLALWDRLERRLEHLRNGRDINGERRRLSLFAPPIDPLALMRADQAGLSVDEVLDTQSGAVPPYRFEFLIARANEQAATVQAFGSALLSALERKDVEALSDLRTVHEDQLLKLQRNVRQWEYDAAAATLEALNRRRDNAEQRRGHYQMLVDGGLNPSEWAQRLSHHVASSALGTVATLDFLAGALHLLPDVGSPFAMKYGGTATGTSVHRFADGTRAVGDFAAALSSVAEMEGGFVRRAEEWREQVTLAEGELDDLDQQIAAATRQRDIAERNIEIHQRTLEQTQEIYDFARERFTRVGLYTWQSTQLQRLHREAFNAALAMGRMAERALRFERDDLVVSPLPGTYWDSARAGLLAGARLANDLQAMERRFLETDTRKLEIDQSFSVAQVDPAAMVALRETGECTFTIPELFFDLAYPGGYRRRIKAVRVTIPAVTGEHTNVGATLTLNSSRLRREPRLGGAWIGDEALPPTTAIATSFAQRDAGVWELDFRGSQYLPMEGAAAVDSEWTLTLPSEFRPFPYELIRDVVLRISYTALHDSDLRTAVETSAQGIVGALRARPLRRLFSLRYEFPDVFNRLIGSPVGTVVPLTLTRTHLPFFLDRRTLVLGDSELALRPGDGEAVDGLILSVDGTPLADFAPSERLSALPAADPGAVLGEGLLGTYQLALTAAGGLAPNGPAVAGARAIGEGKLLDILLYAELTAS